LVLRYADMFYYLSGALFKNAFPVFHPEAAVLCRDKIELTTRLVAPDTRERGGIWQRIMDTWGLTYEALRRLPLSEIAEIRRDSLGMRLRRTWARIVQEARSHGAKEQSLFTFQETTDALARALEREVKLHSKRYAQAQKTRKVLEFGGWVTAGLGFVLAFFSPPSLVFSLPSAVVGLLVGRPVLDGLERHMAKAELVVLATRITQRVWNSPPGGSASAA
jgi:hypothetical protein